MPTLPRALALSLPLPAILIALSGCARQPVVAPAVSSAPPQPQLESLTLAPSTIHDPHIPHPELRQQSPIDLPAYTPAKTSDGRVALHYHATAEHLTHKDHTIELEVDPGNDIEFDGHTYSLDQLHFHTPSEHLVAHQRFPVEAHFVHRDQNGKLLVLGVLFDVGATNSFIERILSDAPRDIGHIDLDRSINLDEILPSKKHVYTYKGSLTTPPYSEDVQWLVLSEHPSVSPEQVVRLLVLEGGNARAVQPRNERVVESATVGDDSVSANR
ncbi:MAG: carbonic anhydrase family protein [Myxococcota bacterium]